MKPVERISATDAAITNIRELILSGSYKVGDKLPTESKLCQMSNVSRTTVREAIRVLQTLGYIKILAGKGAFVASVKVIPLREAPLIDNVDFEDVMALRLVLEPLAATLAAEKCLTNEIEELEDILADFLLSVEKRDSVRMMISDDLFHKQIFMMSKNNLLIEFNNRVSELNMKYRRESFTNEKLYKNAVEPHKSIVKCIKEHDSEGAKNEMRIHMEMALSDMRRMHERL